MLTKSVVPNSLLQIKDEYTPEKLVLSSTMLLSFGEEKKAKPPPQTENRVLSNTVLSSTYSRVLPVMSAFMKPEICFSALQR